MWWREEGKGGCDKLTPLRAPTEAIARQASYWIVADAYVPAERRRIYSSNFKLAQQNKEHYLNNVVII